MSGPLTDGASSINVTVRVRPFTIREAAQLSRMEDGPLFLGDGSLAAVPAPLLKAKGIRPVIKVVDEKCLVFDPPEEQAVQRFGRGGMGQGKRSKDATFGFDRVFDENTTQGDVYEATTKGLLDSVLDGYNATVFAYGATGCGKTHTITGTAQAPGIIFLTMQELFERVEDLKTDKFSEITLSYLEIYNETIRDLLATPGAGGKQGLMLREDANQAVSVAGLSSHNPQNVAEVMDMVIRGNAARTQSPTEANATSSRSHAVLQVNISLKSRDASVHEPVTMATLSIIDLAGSERASATKNRGERLMEGANINKSLLALGSCINALCDPRKKNHVPYRNSKLTRLLKFSLGGNCRTVMIVCVSPSSQHYDETQNTLRYANRAKNIQTKSVRNVYNVDRHVKDYLKKIDEQMSRINELTAMQKQYEEMAFVKFRKAEAKRVEIAYDGVQRIRLAYDHSAPERQDRINNVRRLRQVERRIGAISGWIGAFDQVCETREEEEAPKSMLAMRKTAQGIMVELEGSRQHYHQRLNKSNWCRAIDTALQDGLRQLSGVEGAPGDGAEESLKKETELLKGRMEIDVHLATMEQEKVQDGLMQVLLNAHFETIAILNQILQMSEEEAVQAARAVLGKVLLSCTESVGQVIKPDGGLVITEAVPPTRGGTPGKRRQVPLAGPSPAKLKFRPSAVPTHMVDSPQLTSSPASRPMGSPRRRVKLGGARKGVVMTGTPKKKSPTKKRAVRWRDEKDDGEGALPLVDFQVTPKWEGSSPALPKNQSGQTDQATQLPQPAVIDYTNPATSSSPVPAPPQPSSDLRKSSSGRFATGFLSKRSDGSPAPPPPTLTLGNFSSEDETSPLRERAANSAPRPSTLSHNTLPQPQEHSDDASSASENDHPLDKLNPSDLRTALSRRPSQNRTSLNPSHPRSAHRDRESLHRRRSPTATSPPALHPSTFSNGNTAESIFSASHARRMVKSEREEALRSVLSPRSAPVGKVAGGGVRRSMMVEGTPKEGTEGPRRHVRVSSVVPGSANRVPGPVGATGGGVGGKAAWR
ncbi:tubulin-dependent ATPase kip3 [Oleoguttula sp. CCFEE 5521]